MLDEDWEDYTKIIYAKMASRGEAYLGHRLKKKNGEIIYVFCFGMGISVGRRRNVRGDPYYRYNEYQEVVEAA